MPSRSPKGRAFSRRDLATLPPARAMALTALQRTLGGSYGEPGARKPCGMDVQEALDTVLSHHNHILQRDIDIRDQALATEAVYGYLRLKGRMDSLLNTFLKRPDQIPQTVRLVLGLAAFELLELDKVPAYASVDWAVDFIKRIAGLGLARLANAVLRKVAEVGGEACDPGFYRKTAKSTVFDRSQSLACAFSAPVWLIDHYLSAYGEERSLHYLKAGLRKPPLGLRVNRLREGASELEAELSADPLLLAQNGPSFAFSASPKAMTKDLEQTVRISRQSAAAYEALSRLRPETWQSPVWDACAGHGGKTCALLEGYALEVLASDVNAKRLEGLRRELVRLNLPAIPVAKSSATEPPPFEARPQTILLDAPCSGLGVLARRPDAKWRRDPEDAAADGRLVRLQAAMLDNAARVLPPGGRIAYLTCTLNPAENEEQTDAFLARHPDARQVLAWSTPPDSALGEFFYCALLAV